MAVEPQADFVFDALGPVACEIPPAGFDISQFRAYAENKADAHLVRGEIGGTLATSFAGGGLYGADDAGGFVVAVQGMLFDDAPELTMLCMVLVRVGESDDTAGPIVGEVGLDAAADGSFLGVFKLVRRNADGVPATVATGSVESGTASFVMFGGILVDGSIAVEGSYTPQDAAEPLPFSASIAVPRAENVIRPALRLSRY
ncbi:hypothetical protein [Mesorhizobium sp. CAU 1741]|uniref:hypothetical protein n=1 Tax=Mesorhizobium sp. CAU 1741 TaxID=3140366 RepID=UPI00325BF4B2